MLSLTSSPKTSREFGARSELKALKDEIATLKSDMEKQDAEWHNRYVTGLEIVKKEWESKL